MSPCKFVDLDDDIEAKKDIMETCDTSRKASLEFKSITLSTYWLNEIKSQEDTARQIIAVCTLLLGVSITIITSNYKNIAFFINNDINNTISKTIPYIPNNIYDKYSLILISVINGWGVFVWFFTLISFILIWILAINTARKSLKIEPITNNESRYLENLSNIANVKHEFCKEAIMLILIGITFVGVLVSGLLLLTMGHETIGAVVVLLSGLIVLLCFLIPTKYFFLKLFGDL